MPLMYKCVCCGRLCGKKPHSAEPYKKGWACDECNVKYVIPSIERQQELLRRKYGKID